MTTFTIGKPVSTRTSSIAVDAGLAIGTHRFQLEVIDNDGLRSRPVVADVVIRSGRVIGPVVTPPGRGTVTPVEPVPVRPPRRGPR